MAWALSRTLKSSVRSCNSSILSGRPCSEKDDALHVQVVILGERHVGKSAILSQYLNNRFEEKYKPTVDEIYRHMCRMEDGTYRIVDIIDTAGPYDFPAMQRLWIRQSSGFVIVYSLSEVQSYQSAIDLLHLVMGEKEKDFSVVLVGNKSDCVHDDRISRQAVRALCYKYGCLYIETSAKYRLNVDSIFRCLLMKEVPPRLPQGLRCQGTDAVRPTFLCAKKK